MARVWGGKSFYVPLTGKGPVTVILPRVPPTRGSGRRSPMTAP